MDQSKTNVPAFLRFAKSTQNLQRLRTHISGALVHTRAPYVKLNYAFYDSLQWPHDCDLVVEFLYQIWSDLRGHLPDVLYLQVDNCPRENKNQYFLAFCSLLVGKRIFKKVSVHVTCSVCVVYPAGSCHTYVCYHVDNNLILN